MADPWVQKVVIGNCELYLGDMREVLPALDTRAKLALSDPPYRLTPGGKGTGEFGGCLASDEYDNSGELFPMVEWHEMAPLFHAALQDNADAIIMTSDREEAEARVAFMAEGFAFHRLLIWDKITATPNRWYMPDCEFALYLYKGLARRINNCSSKAKITCPQKDVSHRYLPADTPEDQRKAHATEKPVPLMAHWLLNSTDPGDLVIDPFMGAGATIVAAIQIGRRAIGIEQNPKWFHVACARAREAQEGGQHSIFSDAESDSERARTGPCAAREIPHLMKGSLDVPV
ncbi:MAG: site-specific DNA-methyltransferase [Leisingera sp.]